MILNVSLLVAALFHCFIALMFAVLHCFTASLLHWLHCCTGCTAALLRCCAACLAYDATNKDAMNNKLTVARNIILEIIFCKCRFLMVVPDVR